MATVLVTGGTGMLGSGLVSVLLARGHEVRVLSRHRSQNRLSADARAVVGDVRTAAGFSEAVADADAIIHAATSPRRRAKATEVEGTGHMLEAAANAGVSNSSTSPSWESTAFAFRTGGPSGKLSSSWKLLRAGGRSNARRSSTVSSTCS